MTIEEVLAVFDEAGTTVKVMDTEMQYMQFH